LLGVLRIFTESSISLGLIWRQLESRDSVHARLKLPDKELRYLRIVRVTTAVYQSILSRAHSIHFTYQHRAGASPYISTQRVIHRPVFLLNSRSLFFSADFWRLISKNRFHYRIYFAEFLQISSPTRLSIFYPWTSVGLRYSFFSMVFRGYIIANIIDRFHHQIRLLPSS